MTGLLDEGGPVWRQRLVATLNQRMASGAWRDALSLRVSSADGDVWCETFARAALARDLRRPDGIPFRIASVTKVHVAAAILRLVEDGRLRTDAAIGGCLTLDSAQALRAGGYDVDRVTVEQLMRHTSGLTDHCACDAFIAQLLAQPGHRWTRLEQVRTAMALPGPLSPPGQTFAYSDTGYVLLGEIVEQLSGEALPLALSRLLSFDAIDLRHTWFDGLEPAPVGLGAYAPQYMDDVDALIFDPSFDLFGGGGLVSTLADLDTFFRALFGGRVFARATTLADRFAATTTPCGFGGYAHNGLAFRFTVKGLDCWCHTGFWGVIAAYFPELGLVLTATFNRSRRDGCYGADELLDDFAACVA